MWQKTPEELRAALSAPFQSGDIEWRVSATTQDKTKGLAVAYVTNRAIQNRLDDTVGVDGWYNEFVPWKNGSAQLCGISIYFAGQKVWLTKYDGADDSDIEAVKGGLSDSMKRAAVEWGIGRYLYGMPQIWVGVIQRGKGFAIAEHEFQRLNQVHDDWVGRLGGSAVAPRQPQNPTAGQPMPPSSPPQGGPAPAQSGQHTPPAGSAAGGPSIPEGCCLVTQTALLPTARGGQRLSLQITDSGGTRFQAFLRGENDPRLVPGTLLFRPEFSVQRSGGVVFSILERYQLQGQAA